MATLPILVTPAMLEAGYQEVLKVAKKQRLLWAVKRFPRSFIDAILTEGFMAMNDARTPSFVLKSDDAFKQFIESQKK